MQNSILKRSLNMLQQSVVESFKGNKGQFVDGGLLRQKSVGSAGSGDKARCPTEFDSDSEALQDALNRMRAELAVVKEERGTACKEAENLRQSYAELAEQHKKAEATEKLQRQRNKNSMEELAKRTEELRSSERAFMASEEQLKAAMRNSSELRDEVLRLESFVAEGQQRVKVEAHLANKHEDSVNITGTDSVVRHTSKGAVAQSALEERLEILASRDRLQEECDALRDSQANLRMRLGLMQAERRTRCLRLLAGLLGEDTGLWLQVCFSVWSKMIEFERAAWLRSQIVTLKEESAKHATDALNASEALKAQQSNQRDSEEARKRSQAMEEHVRALKHELLLSNEEVAAHAKRLTSAEQAAAEAERKQRELVDEVRRNKATYEDSEQRAAKMAEELKATQDATEAMVKQLSEQRSCRDSLEKELRGLYSSADALAAAHREIEAAKFAAEKTKKTEEERNSMEKSLQKQKEEAMSAEKAFNDRQNALTNKLRKAEKGVESIKLELERARAEAAKAHANAQAAEDKAKESQKAHAELQQARSSDLEALKLELERTRLDAAKAHAKLERKVEDFQKANELLKAKSPDLESLNLELERTRAEATKAQANGEAANKKAKEFQKANEELQQSKKADLESLKLELERTRMEAAKAHENLEIAEKKVDELKQVESVLCETEERCKELQRAVEEWKSAAREAIAETRRGTRFIVTTPKVSINVGNGEDIDVHVPLPIQSIRESVKNEVVPKFARVVAVADDMQDDRIRADVEQMVEQLALTLQSKLCELIPQDEGTLEFM